MLAVITIISIASLAINVLLLVRTASMLEAVEGLIEQEYGEDPGLPSDVEVAQDLNGRLEELQKTRYSPAMQRSLPKRNDSL